MKTALALAALFLAVVPQQQTFYSAKAEPKPVPAHTAQAVNPGYLYYAANCGGTRSGKSTGRSGKYSRNTRGNADCSQSRPTARPSHRPAPRHS